MRGKEQLAREKIAQMNIECAADISRDASYVHAYKHKADDGADGTMFIFRHWCQRAPLYVFVSDKEFEAES